jgi:YHS domain-containing protein
MRPAIRGFNWRTLGIGAMAALAVTLLHAQGTQSAQSVRAGAGATTQAAQVAQAAQKVNTARGGLAIDGYDPVAYFTEGRPVKGDPRFTHGHRGATYHFMSAASRDLFAKEPDRYVPQFGGFCAYAVSRNYTADTDPLAWKIVDGKLYLNYNTRAQAKWEEDVPGNITKGHANWPGLSRP